jgi:predicted short-subunit dehydrogenase-like oxidoreductase (DUF2520 family)
MRRPPRSLSAAVAFAGAGNAANALARAAAARGIRVGGFLARSRTSAARAARELNRKYPGQAAAVFKHPGEVAAAARLVILAVPDGAIESVARALAPFMTRRHVLCHLSGACSLSPLQSCRPAALASFHPLQTFPARDGGESRIPGTRVAVAGDPVATRRLFAWARKLGMSPFPMSGTDRALYHASAVMASNAVVALFDTAAEMFTKATSRSRSEAAAALMPLLDGTIENLRRRGLPDALSGPVARGDINTVRAHLTALADKPDLRALYRLVSLRAVDLALARKSITNKTALQFRRLLRK